MVCLLPMCLHTGSCICLQEAATSQLYQWHNHLSQKLLILQKHAAFQKPLFKTGYLCLFYFINFLKQDSTLAKLLVSSEVLSYEVFITNTVIISLKSVQNVIINEMMIVCFCIALISSHSATTCSFWYHHQPCLFTKTLLYCRRRKQRNGWTLRGCIVKDEIFLCNLQFVINLLYEVGLISSSASLYIQPIECQ